MTQGFLVVDHGSRREASNLQLIEIAQLVQALRPESLVSHAHMEIAPPTIQQGIDLLVEQGAHHITVLVYFLSDGRHVSEDIPHLVAQAQATYPQLTISIGQALGPGPELAELLLKRADA